MKRAFPIWLLFLVALAAPAAAQSLDLTRARVPGGGGVSAGGPFTLFSTVAQPESAARVAGGAFTLDSGFLGATLPSPIPTVYFPSGTVTVLEDSGAQTRVSYATFEPGDAGPPAQPATFQLSNNNAALFSVAPAMDTSRTLTFIPAPNLNGTATVTVVVRADGVDVATNTFAIVVSAVNDAPAVTLAGNQSVLEDAGPQTVSSFASFTPGPANESAQTPAYTLTADNAALFSAQPAIAANGTLTYTPAANANGSATITVVTSDGGGTDNAGVDKTTNSFTITMTAVNDAPGVTLAQSTVTALEDVGAQSLAGFATFSTGPANESAQTLVGYTVSHNNSALFSAAPALAANGTLTFTPAANANGSATVTVIAQDNGGTTDGGKDRTTNTLTITVSAVNDAPSLAFSANLVVVAIDSGAQTVTAFATFNPGPADEAAQTPAYTVTTDNAALFSAAPAIAANGTLTFTATTGVGGAATVTVVVQDTGGIAGGGVDKATNTFTLSVLSFAGVADSYTVAEDSPLAPIAGAGVLANDIGPALRSVLVATTTNGALTLNLNGSFTYQPATNFFGSDHFTYLATNSTDTSAVTVVTLTVTSLNDAPSVTFAQATVTVLEDAGAQILNTFAAFSPGPASESAQTLVGYTVSNSSNALFSVQPAINSAGVLTFTPATNANGSATATVIVQDSGGTGDSGVDKATNTFVITVTPVNDAPSFTMPVGEPQGIYTVTTLAGQAGSFGSTDATGSVARFNNPYGNAVDVAGNVYVADQFNSTIRKVTPAGVVTTLAGLAGIPGSTDGTGSSARFNYPLGVAVDAAGNVYVADNSNHTIRRIAPGGAVTTVAGQVGNVGSTDGIGSSARFNYPASVSVDQAGNVYVGDYGNNVIRKVTPGGAVSTLAGLAGMTGSADGIGSIARFNAPVGVAADGAGNVYVADAGNNTIRKIFPTGAVITFAGLAGNPGNTDAGGSNARFNNPVGVALDSAGNIYVADQSSHTVRRITTDGGVTTLAGLAGTAGSTDGVGSAARFNRPSGIVVDRAGRVYVGNYPDHTIRRVAPASFGPYAIGLLEDSDVYSATDFVASITPGPANELSQSVSFALASDNPTLFSSQPAVAADGTLTFTPAANANGTAIVTIVAQDDGGTANGGVDKHTNTFSIMVTSVNDAPVVTFAQTTVTLLEDAGAQTLNAFAAFSLGPANESAQTLVGYTVTVDNAALFSTAPAIANNGTLTFTAATNANGSAAVTVVVQDNGGTANGGVDKSTNIFVIVVTAVNDTPVANNDSYAMSQGDVLTVAAAGVLANDTDVENNPLTATKLTNPAHGAITINANGGFSYTPDTSFYGVDSFTYRTSDASSNSAPVTVSLSVLARPVITPPPGRQRVFSSAALRFSATNAPDLNAIRVSDPDSTALTLTLTVTNGTLGITVTNGLAFPNGFTNTNSLVLTGLITNLNDALESLAYVSTTNYFGDDALVLVAQDEGGRTNRGNGVFDLQVEIPARGASLEVPLNGFNNPGLGRMVTNATAVTMDTNLVEGITYDPTNNVVQVQPVGGQDGSTNRTTITVRVMFNDGTFQTNVVPVIIYQPLLTATTNLGTYNSSFGAPLFNPQTSLYEQKVSVVNNTPFDFTALRITATNLPATVTLQNATLTNGGRAYIDYNLVISSGSNVTLKVEYFSSDLQPFTPGLRLELLNQQRATAAPTNATMSAVAAQRNGFDPDRSAKNYLKFPTQAGQFYYVQYQDVVGAAWKTSPVVIRGTGRIYNWIDDGPPNTETAPGPARFYRIVTDR